VERRRLVEWENREVPVKTQAELLTLNRTGLYYQPIPPSAREVAYKHRIDELYTAHPYYGYRRIAAQLHRDGWPINQKTVARYMHEMGLYAVYPGPNLSKRAREAAIFPYLLAHVKAATPNHIWGIDLTYIRLQGGWMYLVAILDWYSRYVVSWELDQTMQIAFVMEAMQRALSQARAQICNSDQGSHFTSPQFTQLLLSHDVRISMDSKGRALDNIFTERLWRTIKYEEVYIKDYASPREAREGLRDYLRFYNEQRVHQSLEYRTPAEVYFAK
jgi:putative transposase